MTKRLSTPRPTAHNRAFRQVSLSGKLLASVGLAALIGAIAFAGERSGHATTSGPVPVQVVNPQSSPVYNADVDHAARNPFATRVFPSAATPATFTVPAGQRLVITGLSAFSFGSTTVQDVAVFTTTAGKGAGFLLPFTVNNHGIVYTGAQQTQIIADPGSTVTVAIDDTNSADSAGMNVDLKGYYVNLP